MANNIGRAIADLRSLQDGDSGVACAIACGASAIPALRTLLFERERSGLYQTRCRAVDALAGLSAHDVLIEFLEQERKVTDPLECMGEDAVINAAALALANVHGRHVFELLLRLGSRPCLTGVIGALGAQVNAEAIPVLIAALEDDASRLTAEAALRKLHLAARSALVFTANSRTPSSGLESESSARRRRSAMRLLSELEIPIGVWQVLEPLIDDADAKVAALACRICFARAPAAMKCKGVDRLLTLLAQHDWVLRDDIEATLVAYFDDLRDTLERALAEAHSGQAARRSPEIESILERIVSHGKATPKSA